MHSAQKTIAKLQRPKLLIRAARTATHEFKWDHDFQNLIGPISSLKKDQLFDTLLQEEHNLNQERLDRAASYSVRKHIRILTALMVTAAAPASGRRAA